MRDRIVLLGLLLAGCASTSDVGSVVEGGSAADRFSVRAASGANLTTSRGFRVLIPPGSLSADTEITALHEEPGRFRSQASRDFSPSGQHVTLDLGAARIVGPVTFRVPDGESGDLLQAWTDGLSFPLGPAASEVSARGAAGSSGTLSVDPRSPSQTKVSVGALDATGFQQRVPHVNWPSYNAYVYRGGNWVQYLKQGQPVANVTVDPGPNPLVCVHGLGGAIHDGEFGNITASINASSVLGFEYDSLAPLASNGQFFGQYLSGLTGATPSVLGHGSGALVVRTAFQSASLPKSSVVLLCPPNLGSAAINAAQDQNLAEQFVQLFILNANPNTNWVNADGAPCLVTGFEQGFTDLRVGSSYLNALNAQPAPPQAVFSVIAGGTRLPRTQQIDSLLKVSLTDGLVDLSSATAPIGAVSQATLPLDDHFSALLGSTSAGTLAAAAFSGYSLPHQFQGGAADGATSHGSLTTDGTLIYGRTFNGGASNNGVVFSMSPDGSGFKLLKTFNGGPDDGANPRHDAMQLSGSTLFGACLTGGKSNLGTVFSLGTDATGYNLLHHFEGGKNDGDTPHSCPRLVNGRLYGLTEKGGEHDKGVLYEMHTDGSKFKVLHSFHPSEGSEPHGAVLSLPDGLYGMTRGGGSKGLGVVFRYDLNSGKYHLVHDFTGGATDGATPFHGNLVSDGTNLYGITHDGGASNKGIVFSMAPATGALTILHSFAGPDGEKPQGTPTLVGTTLYGTTAGAGAGARARSGASPPRAPASRRCTTSRVGRATWGPTTTTWSSWASRPSGCRRRAGPRAWEASSGRRCRKMKKPALRRVSDFGRGDRTRTCDLRFWRAEGGLPGGSDGCGWLPWLLGLAVGPLVGESLPVPAGSAESIATRLPGSIAAKQVGCTTRARRP